MDVIDVRVSATSVKRQPRFRTRIYEVARNLRNDLRDFAETRVFGPTRARRTPFGFVLVGSRSIHHRAMQNGTFERTEVDLVCELLENAQVFVDVGANVGFYSCLARTRGAHVVAVEPQPLNLKYLYGNLLSNGWPDVEVFPVGVAKDPSVVTLYGASTTGASLIANWAGASKRVSQTIPVSTIDIILGSRFLGRNVLIKLDVEGAEYAALQGASMTLRSTPAPTWLVEVCLDEFHPLTPNPNYRATFELFWDNGYEAWTTNSPRRRIERADVYRWCQLGRSDSGVINYLFMRSPTKRTALSSEDANIAADKEARSRTPSA